MANYSSAGIGSGTGARVANSNYVNTVPGALNTDPDVLAAINGDPGAQARIAASNNTSVYFDPSAIAQAIISSLNLQDPTNYMQSAWDIANLNTMTSQALAREQMQFQERANAKAMDFSATEAEKTRDWQTMMSNTAHQREVRDLVAAGLNPVLSANQGAAVGSASSAQGVTSSGAKGNVDTSAVSALVQAYVQTKNIEMQEKSLAIQDKNIEAQLLMNALNNDTNRYAADQGAAASMYGSGLMASANRYGSELAAQASHYAADLNYQIYQEGLHSNTGQALNFIEDWIDNHRETIFTLKRPEGKGSHMPDIDPSSISKSFRDLLLNLYTNANSAKMKGQ